MAEKPKCSQCTNPVLSKGLCSTCYNKEWRAARREGREMVIPPAKPFVEGELLETVQSTALTVVESPVPPTHLVATDPSEMKAAQGDIKSYLEQRLLAIEQEILESNAALNEARRNGWNTSALTAARNRAVDDEVFFNKVLAAVETGYTIIPEFPVDVFAVRRESNEKRERQRYLGVTDANQTYEGRPATSDYSAAGLGRFRNPAPEIYSNVWENRAPGAQEHGENRYHTDVTRTGRPAGPIMFPHFSARSRVMAAAAHAMEQRFFDQIAVCRPMVDAPAARRTTATTAGRTGDPLIIGQVVRKPVGSRKQVVSFIIAWHLNLNEL